MSEQDNSRLDRVFKSKVNSKSAEFREEDWLKAKQLIATDRRNKKKRLFMFFFILLAMLSIGTTYWLYSLMPLEQKNATLANNSTPAATGEVDDQQVHAYANNATAMSKNNDTTEQAAVHPGGSHRTKASVENDQAGDQSSTAYRSEIPASRKNALKQKQSVTYTTKKFRPNAAGKTLPSPEDYTYILAVDSSHGIVTSRPANDVILISTKANNPFLKVQHDCDTCRKTIDSYLAYKSKGHQKTGITLEAGINNYNGGPQWYTPLNFYGGMLFHRFINPHIRLNAGMLYTRIHQNLPARNFIASDFTFGVVPFSVSVQTRRLDYIEIPLSIGYHFYTRHAITAGASYLYMLQSSDFVTTYDKNGSSKEQKSNGYTQGFSSYDIQAHLSYSYDINRYFSVSAGYYLGFSEITNYVKARNNGIRLGIGYKLW